MKMALEVTGIPLIFLMDPDGIVRWEGFPFLDGHELTDAVIEKILAGDKKPDAKETAKPAGHEEAK